MVAENLAFFVFFGGFVVAGFLGGMLDVVLRVIPKIFIIKKGLKMEFQPRF